VAEDKAKPGADDGYTPADEPDIAQAACDADELVLGVPSGDELADVDLPMPESFEVVDDEAEELADGADALDEIDEDQLEEAEAEIEELTATAPVTQRPQKKTAATSVAEAGADRVAKAAPAKKNRPTRTRAEATKADAPKKTGLKAFITQIVQELKKVSWPTGAQLGVFFVVVLVFVLFMIAFIGLLDVLFGWIMLNLFG
jgi:preprotein translocase subunit SecE